MKPQQLNLQDSCIYEVRVYYVQENTQLVIICTTFFPLRLIQEKTFNFVPEIYLNQSHLFTQIVGHFGG